MRYVILLIILFCLIFNVSGANSVTTGIIVKNSPSNFYLKDDSGKENHFYISKATKYIPSDWRSLEGDKVEVTYFTLNTRKKNEPRHTVVSLKLLEKDPKRAEIMSPLNGIIKETRRKWITIDIPSLKKWMQFEKAKKIRYIPAGKLPRPGDEVKIDFRKAPSKFGNVYVYIIETLEIKE